ncbi:phosphatase PAP2 family protein [Gorillibacterium sp. CAU 1737]|uniref:phosphatase PAP2 family protein n=1 Tax=Gorillibacterium sp. CAU 1737 TaxID=3140362 RepID=UPI003261CD3B
MKGVIGLLVVFAALGLAMTQGWTEPIDTSIREWVQAPRFTGLLAFAKKLTWAGDFTPQFLVSLVVAAYLRLSTGKAGASRFLMLYLGGVWVLNTVLKAAYHRERPSVEHLVEASGYSFPSGHAMSSAALYGMLGYLLWRKFRREGRWVYAIPVITVLWILLIGWSRVYLGVHFASDVAGGYAVGCAWLMLCLWMRSGVNPKASTR